MTSDMNVKGKYLNPKADLTFKLLFGEHPDLVKSLLNALLPLEPGREIARVEYATPEMIPGWPWSMSVCSERAVTRRELQKDVQKVWQKVWQKVKLKVVWKVVWM